MHIFFLIIFLASFSPGKQVQKGPEALSVSKNPDRYIHWQAAHPLKWENFKGKPEKDDVVHGAVTYAGIDLQVEKVHLLSGEITFKAIGVFDQKNSWVKTEKRDPQLLAHEQLHFDIAELYARKLERKLNSLKLSRQDKKTIKKWQDHFRKAQLSLQKRYDHETLHGIRAKEQEAWRRDIRMQLLREKDILVNARSRLALEKKL